MNFRTKLTFFVDYTANAKCRYQSHHSVDSQAPKKEHLMKRGIARSEDQLHNAHPYGWKAGKPALPLLASLSPLSQGSGANKNSIGRNIIFLVIVNVSMLL
jgi:hypothetical protein